MGEGVRGIVAISRSNYRAAGELGHSDGCGPGCQLLRGQESSHCGPVKERLMGGRGLLSLHERIAPRANTRAPWRVGCG